MTDQKNIRVCANLIRQWAENCLQSAGAAPQLAHAMAKNLVAADLMGFRTHGLARLRYNMNCLQDGSSRAEGDYRVVNSRAAVQLWDADLLSGLYVLPDAVQAAINMATNCGTGTVIVKRAQHVAALAVYLEQATAAGMLIQMMCATPGQQVVAPYGAKSAWFSPNPFAVGAPTQTEPVLLDISLSMTAAGKVRQAIAEQQPLPYAALITAAGDYTADPRTFIDEPASVLAPLGGEQLGYKGSGLCLFSELWTLALSQLGRHQEQAGLDANTVWIQVIDPAAFGDADGFKAQAQALVDGMRKTTPIDANKPVRIPGQGALANRADQLAHGVTYTSVLWQQLQKLATKANCPLPQPVA